MSGDEVNAAIGIGDVRKGPLGTLAAQLTLVETLHAVAAAHAADKNALLAASMGMETNEVRVAEALERIARSMLECLGVYRQTWTGAAIAESVMRGEITLEVGMGLVNAWGAAQVIVPSDVSSACAGDCQGEREDAAMRTRRSRGMN